MKYSFFIVTLLVLVYGNLLSQTFTRITEGDIVNDGGNSYGTAWGDYNNDGYLDLFVSNGAWMPAQVNFLYRNNGDSTFVKINIGDVVNDTSGSLSCSWSDYDNDGDLDLFVTTFLDFKNFLYRNNSDGTFSKILTGDIVNDVAGSWSSSWGDYNNDDDLDLFVSNVSDVNNFLYRNDGDGTFTKITTGDIVNDGGDGTGSSWGDYDNDGDLDLFVTNGGFGASKKNFLYQNNGDSTFTKITTGDIVNDTTWSESCSWADYDNDGDLDLLVTNIGNNSLYTNNDDGTFTKVIACAIVNDVGQSFSSAWGDYDNDGDLDLFLANVDTLLNSFLYSNNGNGTFTKITTGNIVNDGGGGTDASWGDYDNDGDLDLFVDNWDQNNFLYANNGNTNKWINLKLFGIQSNSSGIGAKVRLKATIFGNSYWQMREISGGSGRGGQNTLNAEFGLGDATIIDSLKIEWPSGIIETYTDIGVDQFITATENGGITGITENSHNLPNQFELSQNFPNPFNPTTKIIFHIPELSFVTIKVYDVLGSEIAALVNEEKPVGSYEVEFSAIGGSASGGNAYTLPSGVYFYRLQVYPTNGRTGNYVETKKMVLIK